MRAAQVMTLGAATISPDASVREAARMMLDYRISGLPVVDGDGNLVGIVTEGDLISGISGDRNRRRWLEFILDPVNSGSGRPAPQTVGEIMSRHVISATEDTPVYEIVKQMKANGIKRVPVVKDGKVIGIISRADLLRGLALEAKMMPEATAQDFALRDQVIEALAKEARDRRNAINVLVQNGTVELRGAVTDPSLPKRLVETARQVPGTKQVVDRLVTISYKPA